MEKKSYIQPPELIRKKRKMKIDFNNIKLDPMEHSMSEEQKDLKLKLAHLKAEEGDKDAQYYVGMITGNGEWIERAATNGHIEAMLNLGKGNEILYPDVSFLWFKKASSLGSAYGDYRYGKLLIEKEGKSYLNESINLFKRCCKFMASYPDEQKDIINILLERTHIKCRKSIEALSTIYFNLGMKEECLLWSSILGALGIKEVGIADTLKTINIEKGQILILKCKDYEGANFIEIMSKVNEESNFHRYMGDFYEGVKIIIEENKSSEKDK